MSKFTDNNIKWVLPIIAFAKYLFMALTVMGLAVWSLDMQQTELGRFFSDRITDALFRTWLVFEVAYWALKYKKLSISKGGAK